MGIHIVYRTYGGENDKGRPAWFGKLLCAASLARAAEAAGVRVTWLNDGPVPQEWLELFRQFGDVVQIPGGPVGMRRSYVTALRYAITSDWADDDLVYFCEDDYLHTPDAITSLAELERHAQVSYVALHGATPEFANAKEYPDGFTYPHGWHLAPEFEAAGHRWVHGVSTTSTFGARLKALRSDYSLFRQAMFPFRTRFLDHETCLLYQGEQPYRGREFLLGLQGDFVPGLRGIARAAVLVPFRIALQIRSRRNATDRHLLYTAAPNLACHAENDIMNPGRDWEALAAGTRAWAQDRGLLTALSAAS